MLRLFLFCVLVGASLQAPTSTESDVTEDVDNKRPEVLIIPARPFLPDFRRFDDSYEDSDEDRFGGFFRPVMYNPFGGFFGGFSDMFHRLNTNMNGLFNIAPINPFNKVYNSTSTTKIVDGHKITINKTVYHNDDEEGALHVQVVEIGPIDEEQDVQTTTTRSPETVSEQDNSQDNEIVKEEVGKQDGVEDGVDDLKA